MVSCIARNAAWLKSSLGGRLAGLRFGAFFGFFMAPVWHVYTGRQGPEKSNCTTTDYVLGLGWARLTRQEACREERPLFPAASSRGWDNDPPNALGHLGGEKLRSEPALLHPGIRALES